MKVVKEMFSGFHYFVIHISKSEDQKQMGILVKQERETVCKELVSKKLLYILQEESE